MVNALLEREKGPTHDPDTSLREALWHNNPALIQLLGLCPLLR